MAQSADEECGICLDALTSPVALPCSHKFCSDCLESWRSKYGPRGDREKRGRACPLCREKIPPSNEMMRQLEFYRKLKNRCEAEGDILSSTYSWCTSQIERLEEEVGDWTGEVLDDVGDESLALPKSIWKAVEDGNIQTVLGWLGPPPVDKRRINAKCAELGADANALNAMGYSALAAVFRPAYYQQAKLLLEWGAATDPPYFGKTTKEEVISLFLIVGNVKLASLLKSELGGRRCELVNFTKSPELNGKTCVVEKHLPDKDRYKITFEGSGEKALVPPDNLKRRDRTPTDCGYYITFENGRYSRRDFASKEECQAYVAELESKHATDQLACLDVNSSATANE